MIWVLTGVAFLGTVLVVMALVFALSGGNAPISERLSRLWRPPAPDQEVSFKAKQKDRVQRALVRVGKLVPGAPPSDSTKMQRSQRLMARAGFRRPEAVTALQGMQVIL